MTEKHNDNKIIPFPGVVERLLDKAFFARENNNQLEALNYLKLVVEHDPDNVSGLYGLAVTYYDLEDYERAKEVARFMFEKEIGDYAEVLRLYVASLIQLEDYDIVSTLLNTVFAEKRIPSPLLEEFEEIRKTCEFLILNEQMEVNEESLRRSSVLKKMEENPRYSKKLCEQLEKGNFEEQLSAIEQLKYIDQPDVIHTLKEYLIKPHPEPILKSFAMRALKEMGIGGTVRIHKFDRLLETRLDEVPLNNDDLPEQEKKVIDIIVDHIHESDPSFLSFALQVWMEYLFSVLPLHPDIRKPETWAAALHYTTSKMLNKSVSQQDVAEIYGVSAATVSSKCKEFANVLRLSQRSDSLS